MQIPGKITNFSSQAAFIISRCYFITNMRLYYSNFFSPKKKFSMLLCIITMQIINVQYLPLLFIHLTAMGITLYKDINQKKNETDLDKTDWTSDDWSVSFESIIWRKIVRYFSQITILTNSIFLLTEPPSI